MRIPDSTRIALGTLLWVEADRINWQRMSLGAKARQYMIWSRQPEIGGLVEKFGDRTKIGVYLRDSILQGYSQVRVVDSSRPFSGYR